MKGWAHVGVLAVLEEVGLKPDRLAGSSSGAMIAAFVACGYRAADIAAIMRRQRTRRLFSLRFDRYGLLSFDGVRDYLREHFGDRTFRDLVVPLHVVCTDLHTGREVVISEGPLLEAVLASSAVPGVFAPIEWEGRLLVDGGLSNNVPVSALVNHGADLTVAVQPHKPLGPLHAGPRSHGPDVERAVGLGDWASRLRSRFRRDPSPSGPVQPNALEVVERALGIVQAQLEGFRLNAYPPDVLVVPRTEEVRTFAFSEEKDIIYERGVEAALAVRPELERLAVLAALER